jgi:diguanylate cyclase
MSTAATSLPERNAAEAADFARVFVADWSATFPGMRVTIFAGVKLRDKNTSDTFFARADGALHFAKAQGRNRITTS